MAKGSDQCQGKKVNQCQGGRVESMSWQKGLIDVKAKGSNHFVKAELTLQVYSNFKQSNLKLEVIVFVVLW